ncbi:hypothetical protein FACS1894190_02580 [Spirochaetia bacterium]|nr:hypothetical protein FACS1894190_02580 [Spirochaetia bacterium]
MQTKTKIQQITKLESGKTYSISELFIKKRKIIIPDLQRDYCWGDRKHGSSRTSELVGGFFDNLLDLSKTDEELQIGMLYAYENPQNYIYLCDGQQRITTLYLIMGILYRELRDKKIKSILISDFELSNDNRDARLQYAIREITLYFLSSLVFDYFLDTGKKVNDVKKSEWYFDDYEQDPTIQSMISAMRIIDEKISGILREGRSVLRQFANFIVSKVKFFYFDMKNRRHGEEMFVLINTTGEPLTVGENLKPILLGKEQDKDELKRLSDIWEKWETWFWKNRDAKEHEADNGMNDFLEWCIKIIYRKDSVDLFKDIKGLSKSTGHNAVVSEIDKYFEILKKLITILGKNAQLQQQFIFVNGKKKDKIDSIIDLRNLTEAEKNNILLPLLFFMSKIKDINTDNGEEIYQFTRRLRKNFFDNHNGRLKHQKRIVNYVDWRYVIQIIAKKNTLEEMLTFRPYVKAKLTPVENVKDNSEKWYNYDMKITKRLKDKGYQKEVEEFEDNPDFMGDISPLFKIANQNIEIKRLQSFYNIYKRLQNNDYGIFYNNDEIKNRFDILTILKGQKWYHGSTQYTGYCMLTRQQGVSFHNEWFFDVWKLFPKCKSAAVLNYELKRRIRNCFKEYCTKKDIDKIMCGNIQEVNPYTIVMIWLILEFIKDNKFKDRFSYSNYKCISCFWNIDYNLINETLDNSQAGKYQLGNLKLGTSYADNRSGLNYLSYRLMKELHDKKTKITAEEIDANTKQYVDLLTRELILNPTAS